MGAVYFLASLKLELCISTRLGEMFILGFEFLPFVLPELSTLKLYPHHSRGIRVVSWQIKVGH
jgi:hypothetical protein